MGYHADVYEGIVELLHGALPASVPILNAISVSELEFDRYASSVVVLRESIDYEPHPEINPDTSVRDQGEEWSWALYITGGGGGTRPTDRAEHVDLMLEKVRTALNARRPTSDCGPLHLVDEVYEGRSGNGVMYVQRWRHRRLS